MEFTLPLDIEIVFNANSMVMLSKNRKVSSCVKSEMLCIIVKAIRFI